MNEFVVVDASLAVKWLVKEADSDQGDAHAVRIVAPAPTQANTAITTDRTATAMPAISSTPSRI